MNDLEEMRGWSELPSCVDYYFARAEKRSQFDRAEHYGAELEKRQAIERKQKEAFEQWFEFVWRGKLRGWRKLKEMGIDTFGVRMLARLS